MDEGSVFLDGGFGRVDRLEAARAADEARGGSMAPMLRYEAMAELTQQRIKQLKTRLTDGAAPNEKEANTPTPRPTATSSISTQGPDEKPTAAAPSPSFVSPDKKWEFRVDGKGNPQIVRTGTTEMAVELYDKCGPGLDNCKPPLWAPDSKRFAMNAPEQARYNPTSFYQLKGDKWGGTRRRAKRRARSSAREGYSGTNEEEGIAEENRAAARFKSIQNNQLARFRHCAGLWLKGRIGSR